MLKDNSWHAPGMHDKDSSQFCLCHANNTAQVSFEVLNDEDISCSVLSDKCLMTAGLSLVFSCGQREDLWL